MPVTAMLIVLVCLASVDASAWNAGGHRLIAALAWNELSENERQAVTALLSVHPDAKRWMSRPGVGGDPGFVLITEASTWADDIRHDQRFYDEELDPPTPQLPGFPDMKRHRAWHYLNLPIEKSPERRAVTGELDSRLGRLAEIVADSRAPVAGRSYALAWLLHLAGDIHQPLHVATRRDDEGRDDSGGNGLPVFDPRSRRRSETNLHAWWDDLPAPPWLRGRRLEQAAAAIAAEATGAPIDTATAVDIERWRDESHRLARDVAYGRFSLDGLLDDEYRQTARTTAMAQIARAGRRLGRFLGDLLGSDGSARLRVSQGHREAGPQTAMEPTSRHR